MNEKGKRVVFVFLLLWENQIKRTHDWCYDGKSLKNKQKQTNKQTNKQTKITTTTTTTTKNNNKQQQRQQQQMQDTSCPSLGIS